MHFIIFQSLSFFFHFPILIHLIFLSYQNPSAYKKSYPSKQKKPFHVLEQVGGACCKLCSKLQIPSGSFCLHLFTTFGCIQTIKRLAVRNQPQMTVQWLLYRTIKTLTIWKNIKSIKGNILSFLP